MAREGLLRYRAERLLRKDFSGLRTVVLARVRARLATTGARLDMADLDECYGQAWHALYAAMLAGEQVDEVAAWLVEVTFRRAIDELRARLRQEALGRAQAQVVSGAGALTGGALAGSDDMAAELDRRDILRRVLEAFSAGLSPRERRAATLCYLHGLSRARAARLMGVSERRMRKLMDGSAGRPGVAAKVDELLKAIGAGEWCERQSSLMRAYALGMLDPQGERHGIASAHVRDCPRCRAFVLFLRGLASILPPLPLPLPSRVAKRARRQARSPAPRPRTARALLPKLALAGVAVLGLAAERAPLADRATGRPVRQAVAAPALRPANGRRRPGHPAKRLETHARHGARLAAKRPASRARRPVAASPLLAGTAPGQAASRPSSAPAPLGEFTPERTR